MRRRAVLLLTVLAVVASAQPLQAASTQAGPAAHAGPAATETVPAAALAGPAAGEAVPTAGETVPAAGETVPAAGEKVAAHAGPAAAHGDSAAARARRTSFRPAAARAEPAAAVRMTFDAGPEPVARGMAVTLTGRVWRTALGNKARVQFYFHAIGTPANSYTYQGFAVTTDAGNFSRVFSARTTGTWKAVFAGSAERRNAARLDSVQVFQRRSREIAGWSEQTTAWQSPTIQIPTRDYKALVSWTCAETGTPFIYLTWTGEGGGSEFVRGAMTTGALTLNGHAGARKGFFKVSSAADCSWRVRVFSGIAAFQV